jgi:hypothetical protein
MEMAEKIENQLGLTLVNEICNWMHTRFGMKRDEGISHVNE